MTVQGKKTTAGLVSGDLILITNDPAKASTRTGGDWHPSRVKTTVTAATVLRKDTVSGRRRTRYDVVTDAGTVPSVSGSQTFLLASQIPNAEATRVEPVNGAP